MGPGLEGSTGEPALSVEGKFSMATNPETITPINHDALREVLRKLMADEGLSQNACAGRIGVSAAALSGFLGGTYKGNENEVAAKITRWINQRNEAEKIHAVMPVAPGWISTPTGRKILDALAFAQMAPDIAVIYGGAGFGKSSAINRYKTQAANVWAVTATPATASVGVLLEECTHAMGLRDLPVHPAKLQRAIVDKVKDSGGLIVIDEAQHLTKQSLEQMRSIHDVTGVGLALAGNQSVYNLVYRGGTNGFAQLFSRIGKRVPLKSVLAGDVAALANGFKVKSDKELQLLEEIAKNPGALRMVVKTLRLASMAAGGDAPTQNHLRQAWRELQGDVAPEKTASC